MAVAECGIHKGLAEYHGQKSAPARGRARRTNSNTSHPIPVRVIEADTVRAISRPLASTRGRPASINSAQVRELKSQCASATEIAKAPGIGRGERLPGVGSRPVIPDPGRVIRRRSWDVRAVRPSMRSNVINPQGGR